MDGHFLLRSPLAIDGTLYKHLPYDPAKDFASRVLIATIPFVLVVNNDLPVRSVNELIAYPPASVDRGAGEAVPTRYLSNNRRANRPSSSISPSLLGARCALIEHQQ